jgi:hypothetical protein
MIENLENTINWISYLHHITTPYINHFVAIGFHSIIIKRIFDIIKNKVNQKIESEVNGEE